jgi:hypothetical protein
MHEGVVDLELVDVQPDDSGNLCAGVVDGFAPPTLHSDCRLTGSENRPDQHGENNACADNQGHIHRALAIKF